MTPIPETSAGATIHQADNARAFTNVIFTPDAHTLADTLNVKLPDKDTLARIICKDTADRQSLDSDIDE
jgi:hypothetical protein